MKRFIALLLGSFLGFGIWLGNSEYAVALSFEQRLLGDRNDMPTIVEPPSLQTTVEQELHHIPQGFYGILDINALTTKIEQDPIVLVDVRQPSEYRSGHIEGAINIPLRNLADNLNQIPTNQPVIVYCSTGYRTGIGVMALHLLGYENVMGFPPSYEGWKQSHAK